MIAWRAAADRRLAPGWPFHSANCVSLLSRLICSQCLKPGSRDFEKAVLIFLAAVSGEGAQRVAHKATANQTAVELMNWHACIYKARAAALYSRKPVCLG